MVAYLCSRDNRVTRLERDGHSWAAHSVLDGVSATCVATDGGRVLVGTRGDGARLSLDGGGSWESTDLPERDVYSAASCTARTRAVASPTIVPGQSATRTALRGTRPRRGALMRPLVTGRPGAATAASAGKLSTPGVTLATAGLWRSIRPILTAGTY